MKSICTLLVVPKGLRPKKESEYSRISTNNLDLIPENSLPAYIDADTRSLVCQLCIYALVAIFSAALTATTLFILYPPLHQSLPLDPSVVPTIDTGCGHSVAEALANNCTFDMMASTWEAPACHDASLLSSVLATGPWQWYRDRAHTELVPRSEVAEGRFPIEPLYPDSDYHIGHCMYMWMKQHRAFMTVGGAVSEDLWSYEHTVHCARLVLREEWPSFGRTQAGFSVCRNREGWAMYE